MDAAIASIVVSLITSVGTLLGVVVTVSSSRNKDKETLKEHVGEIANSVKEVKTDVNNSLTLMNQSVDARFSAISKSITDLEKAQNKHNGVIERTYKLESDMRLVQQEQKDLEKDVDELKRSVKP